MRLSDYRRSNKTDVDPPSTIDASSARHDAGRNGPAVVRVRGERAVGTAPEAERTRELATGLFVC
jgi:hypothetical protein